MEEDDEMQKRTDSADGKKSYCLYRSPQDKKFMKK